MFTEICRSLLLNAYPLVCLKSQHTDTQFVSLR